MEERNLSEQEFEIWVEGYVITGQKGTATCIGKEKGYNFKNVVEKFMKNNKDIAKLFDPVKFTHWGCKIFDNEIEARKSFG